ncbi:hypothetical protein GCM10022197_08280 [Microlunatus spumicola]|uniref:Uncharacterized protein n=1 Tax=Microlunatus spumicola TaxID=81499 RepID=A0ABP6WR66_9ACTN
MVVAVVGPRRHQEALDEAVGLHGVAEQDPPDGFQVPMLATNSASHTQRNTGHRSGAHIPTGAAPARSGA